LLVVNELNGIDLLIQLYRLEMVKLGLVTLDLSEVSVVEIPRVLEFVILENDHTSTLISYCKIFSGFVKANGRENIILGYVFLITFSESIDIDPIQTVSDTIRVNTWLATGLQVFTWQLLGPYLLLSLLLNLLRLICFHIFIKIYHKILLIIFSLNF